MRSTAVLLTVILLSTGLFSCITKDKPKTYAADVVLPEIQVKKEDTVQLPPQGHKDSAAPKTVKVKFKKPKPVICSEPAPPPPPEKDYTDSIVFTKVEIEAEYPGGPAAWQRFLIKNLRYPQELLDDDILTCTAVVQFIVDKEGNVSDVEAVSGPEAFSAESVRLIRKSGKWVPAVQGGRQVRSLKIQPIIVHPETEG